jgi:hypothetical protein
VLKVIKNPVSLAPKINKLECLTMARLSNLRSAGNKRAYLSGATSSAAISMQILDLAEMS